MRVLIALAALALAVPATAQQWPQKTDRKPLSARAQTISGPDYYVKGDDLDYTARELAACTAPPDKPDYCVDVVLNLARPYEAAERPLVEAAMDTILSRYPVDPFPLLAWRHPPSGDRLGGLISLGLAEDKSGTQSELGCRNVRVRTALAIARWQMGGTAVPAEPEHAIRHCGADSAEVVAAANARAVIFASRGGLHKQVLEDAALAHSTALRAFGASDRRTAIAAANRGALLAETGAWSEAEPLLRSAFAVLDTPRDRPAALAALVPLVELLLELSRAEEARVLLGGAAARDPAIGGPVLHLRALAAQGKLMSDNTAALALFERAVALARATAAQPPDSTLVAFQRHQIDRLPSAYRNMDLFQRSIETERQELERLGKARLAETLAARAIRAFAASQHALARDSAREARTLDPTIRRAFLYEGLASLVLGEGGDSEFLFGSAAIGLPLNHPDRLLVMMGMTLYQMGWNATYAPCYAKLGTATALSRLATERGDSADNSAAYRSYGPIFRLQVMASWISADLQRRRSTTLPYTCPMRLQ